MFKIKICTLANNRPSGRVFVLGSDEKDLFSAINQGIRQFTAINMPDENTYVSCGIEKMYEMDGYFSSYEKRKNCAVYTKDGLLYDGEGEGEVIYDTSQGEVVYKSKENEKIPAGKFGVQAYETGFVLKATKLNGSSLYLKRLKPGPEIGAKLTYKADAKHFEDLAGLKRWLIKYKMSLTSVTKSAGIFWSYEDGCRQFAESEALRAKYFGEEKKRNVKNLQEEITSILDEVNDHFLKTLRVIEDEAAQDAAKTRKNRTGKYIFRHGSRYATNLYIYGKEHYLFSVWNMEDAISAQELVYDRVLPIFSRNFRIFCDHYQDQGEISSKDNTFLFDFSYEAPDTIHLQFEHDKADIVIPELGELFYKNKVCRHRPKGSFFEKRDEHQSLEQLAKEKFEKKVGKYIYKKKSRYCTSIHVNGKQYILSYFSSKKDAENAQKLVYGKILPYYVKAYERQIGFDRGNIDKKDFLFDINLVYPHTIEIISDVETEIIDIPDLPFSFSKKRENIVWNRDLTGQRFGRLTVIKKGKPYCSSAKWVCKCDCGSVKEIRQSNLIDGLSKSCGCMAKTRWMKKRLSSFSNENMPKVKNVGNKYYASIGFQGKRYNLGSFATEEEAAQVKLDAENILYKSYLDAENAWFEKAKTHPDLSETDPFRFNVTMENGEFIIDTNK